MQTSVSAPPRKPTTFASLYSADERAAVYEELRTDPCLKPWELPRTVEVPKDSIIFSREAFEAAVAAGKSFEQVWTDMTSASDGGASTLLQGGDHGGSLLFIRPDIGTIMQTGIERARAAARPKFLSELRQLKKEAQNEKSDGDKLAAHLEAFGRISSEYWKAPESFCFKAENAWSEKLMDCLFAESANPHLKATPEVDYHESELENYFDLSTAEIVAYGVSHMLWKSDYEATARDELTPPTPGGSFDLPFHFVAHFGLAGDMVSEFQADSVLRPLLCYPPLPTLGELLENEAGVATFLAGGGVCRASDVATSAPKIKKQLGKIWCMELLEDDVDGDPQPVNSMSALDFFCKIARKRKATDEPLPFCKENAIELRFMVEDAAETSVVRRRQRRERNPHRNAEGDLGWKVSSVNLLRDAKTSSKAPSNVSSSQSDEEHDHESESDETAESRAEDHGDDAGGAPRVAGDM
eukprot:g16863.t1